MKTLKALILSFLASLLLLPGIVPAELMRLDDAELSAHTGQALLMMDKQQGVAVSGTQNDQVTFYKMGLDAQLELNTNIQKLQLGCGGINGPGCDIDIDNLSLSGDCSTSRPNCSAVLTRPFVEFAIKNDSNPATREITGFRFSAEKALGLLTVGDNTPTPNGLNTISGYMVAASNVSGATVSGCPNLNICGTAYTQAVNLGGRTDPNLTVLRFDTDPNILACTSGCFRGNTGTSVPGSSDGVNIPVLTVPFTGAAAVINGTRRENTSVVATGAVPQVSLDGGRLFVNMEQTISVLYFISVSSATVNMQGSVSGLSAQINFTEDLGYIHNIKVNSPFSLAFQKEAVKWPGTASADVAQRGWWMSFADPVDLGRVNPVQQISIVPTFNQMSVAFQQYFEANPIPISTNQGLQQLFNGQMTVNVGALTIPSTLYMNVSDLQLGATQNVPPNCWGSAKFC